MKRYDKVRFIQCPAGHCGHGEVIVVNNDVMEALVRWDDGKPRTWEPLSNLALILKKSAQRKWNAYVDGLA